MPDILKFCAGSYLLVSFVDLFKSHRYKRFIFQLLPLIGILVLDISIASARAGYLTFGPDSSPTFAVVVMFVAILLGIAARYIFFLKGGFSWLDFAKPVCISPILLLPIFSSMQAVKSLDARQLVSFALLAFQNGFFWQAVLAQQTHATSRPERRRKSPPES